MKLEAAALILPPDLSLRGAPAGAQLSGAPGGQITVYKDRLRRFLDDHRNLTVVATSYVLAHELARAMQGVARHSESGILNAH